MLFNVRLTRELELTIEAPDQASLEAKLDTTLSSEIESWDPDGWLVESMAPTKDGQADLVLHAGAFMHPEYVPYPVDATGASWLDGLTVTGGRARYGSAAFEYERLACWTDRSMALVGPVDPAAPPSPALNKDVGPILLRMREECRTAPARIALRPSLLAACAGEGTVAFDPPPHARYDAKRLRALLERLDGERVTVQGQSDPESCVLLAGETRWALLMPLRYGELASVFTAWL